MAYETVSQADVTSTLTTTTSIDTVTAGAITEFLDKQGVFNNGGEAVIQTITQWGYTDPTSNTNVLSYSGTDPVVLGGALAGGETLPSSNVIILDSPTNNLNVIDDLGNDYLFATGDGNSQITFGAGSSGNSTVLAGAGDDRISAYGTGSYTIAAGAGNDSIYAGGGNATIDLTEGASTVKTIESSYTDEDGNVTTTNYANAVQLEGSNATITGSDNGDLFNIFAGSSSITGGNGLNTFVVKTDGAQTLIGGDGGNYFHVTSNDANLTLAGGAGADQYNLNVTSGSVSITGSAGGDVLNISSDIYTSYSSKVDGVDGSGAATTTYTFGAGADALNVTISNPNDVSINYIHFK